MEKKPDKNYVCIYRTPSHDQLAIIKSLLDSNKIPYFIENEHFASLTGVSDGAVNFGIMINNTQLFPSQSRNYYLPVSTSKQKLFPNQSG